MTEHRISRAPEAAAVTFRRGEIGDNDAVDRIDGSFTTGTVFDIRVTSDGFALHEVAVSPPIVKHFPDEPDGNDDDNEPVLFVAVDPHGDICGSIDIGYEEWNRRLTIADIKIAPNRRREGLGRKLIDLATEYGRERGARTLWLEVTNINTPAVKAYHRVGFIFCGLDTSLYRGTPSEGEIALFMSLDLAGHSSSSDGIRDARR